DRMRSIGSDPIDPRFRAAQLALFRASVLKQAKWRELSAAVGPTTGLDALDLGADNGVISWMFRQQGGRWTSADLTDETVSAIRAMVGERVHRLCDASLPFPDAAFDRVVVIDLLEHVADDRRLLAEIARCLRPGGRAVLHVPHAKRWALLPPLRHALGLTDEWHGHLRPGYDRATLERLLPGELRLVRARTYSRVFSHLLDTALNWAYLRGTRAHAVRTAKGTVVTGRSVGSGGSRALGALYPAMRAFVALDALVPWTRGYMLVACVEKVPTGAAAPSTVA
ncbi:MAG TPA: class I SAM-dependent methyltransferase, partial [Gemmatimonadaceae bacterium]